MIIFLILVIVASMLYSALAAIPIFLVSLFALKSVIRDRKVAKLTIFFSIYLVIFFGTYIFPNLLSFVSFKISESELERGFQITMYGLPTKNVYAFRGDDEKNYASSSSWSEILRLPGLYPYGGSIAVFDAIKRSSKDESSIDGEYGGWKVLSLSVAGSKECLTLQPESNRKKLILDKFEKNMSSLNVAGYCIAVAPLANKNDVIFLTTSRYPEAIKAPLSGNLLKENAYLHNVKTGRIYVESVNTRFHSNSKLWWHSLFFSDAGHMAENFLTLFIKKKWSNEVEEYSKYVASRCGDLASVAFCDMYITGVIDGKFIKTSTEVKFVKPE